MRIAHVSDIHIRNFKYRDEYRAAFGDLYRQLHDLRPDLVVNTGDTVHSKLAVSPELFDDVAEHMLAVSAIAPYWVTLGNHDLNLRNPGRTDAISPIVRALQGRTRCELRLMLPGLTAAPGFHPFRFWNFDIRGHGAFEVDPGYVNVGLYHGSVSGCVTDQGFVMEEAEAELSKFDGMDFVLLGDIHRRQSFRHGRVRYPGSLIQQNYGEDLIKGFLLWDLRSREDFDVEFHPVAAPRRFYTVQVPASLELPSVEIPTGSRIRAMVSGEISPSQRLELEARLREAYDPVEVMTPDSSGEVVRMEAPDVDSLVGSRDRLMLDHLRERSCVDPESVIHLFHGYEDTIDADVSGRGTSWRLRRIEWDNVVNYGEGNVVDLAGLRGLVGVFAPNASGKSSIFDVLMQALFDRVSKDVPRNIDLVNDNRDLASMRVVLESGGREFRVERTIERISYGQRRLPEVRQWGRTSLDFSSDGVPMNGTTRPETERAIRSVVGSFEDFALTAMVTQGPVFGIPGGADLINCRETDRRKILFRILDLDVYERVGALVREDLKQAMGRLRGDREGLQVAVGDASSRVDLLEHDVAARRSIIDHAEAELEAIRRDITSLVDVQDRMTEISRARDRRTSREKIARIKQGKLVEATRRLEEAEARASLLQKSPIVEPEGGVADLSARLDVVRRETSSVSKSLTKVQSERRAGIRSLEILGQVPCGDSFPECQFIVGAHRFRQTLGDIDRSISELLSRSQANGALQHDLERARRTRDEFDTWRRSLDAAETERSTAQERLDEARDQCDEAIALWVQARTELNELSADTDGSQALEILFGRRAELEATLASARRDCDSSLIRLGAARVQLEASQANLTQYDEVKRSVRELEELAEMCGKNGLPYRILGLVLPVINAEIAKILAGVVRFGVYFEDDPDEQTVSLYIRYGDYRSRPLSLGSGAERFIASLAVRVALLSVTSLPKTDILIIDEGFGRLDPEHLESLQRMLEYLREAFGTVFIVSHVDFMRDIVDHTIEITSRDGYAHVEAT